MPRVIGHDVIVGGVDGDVRAAHRLTATRVQNTPVYHRQRRGPLSTIAESSGPNEPARFVQGHSTGHRTRDGNSPTHCASGGEVHQLRRADMPVDDVSLHVGPHEIVGLLGPNGAGKTVTFCMIAGLITPTSGSVLVDGVDVTGLPMHRRARHGMTYLAQERSVFRHLNAEENIAGVLELHGWSRVDARHHAMTLLARFGLARLANTEAGRLSGGEQRRLEVARAVATEPRFLLSDEPFTGIDPLTIEMLHGLFAQLREKGLASCSPTTTSGKRSRSATERTFWSMDVSLRTGPPPSWGRIPWCDGTTWATSKRRNCRASQLPNGATANERNCQTAHVPKGATAKKGANCQTAQRSVRLWRGGHPPGRDSRWGARGRAAARRLTSTARWP